MNPKYLDPNYKGPTLVQHYLKKLKSENAKSRFIKRFNKRFFILDLQNYYLGYKDDMKSSKIVSFSLSDLINIDPNPRIIEVCDWKFAFVVQIGQRIMHLYADSVSIHNEWCVALRACLKPIERMIFPVNQEKPPVSEVRTSSPVEESSENRDKSIKEGSNRPEDRKIEEVLEKLEEKLNLGEKDINYGNFPREQVKAAFATKEENNVRANPTPRTQSFNDNTGFVNVNSSQDKFSNQLNSNLVPLPVFERAQSQPEKPVYVEPKFNVIKNNLDQARPHASYNRKDEDDEEITVISGPVKSIKQDDIPAVNVAFATPLLRGIASPKNVKKQVLPNEKKVEINEKPNLETNIFNQENMKKKAFQLNQVEFRPGGIQDVINGFDDLGLEHVHVRPVKEVKQNLKKEPSPMRRDSVNDKFGKTDFEAVREKKKFQVKENFEFHDDEFFAPEPGKATFYKAEKQDNFENFENLEKQAKVSNPPRAKATEKFEIIENPEKPARKAIGKISVKPGFSKASAQRNYVERPEVVPDDGPNYAANPSTAASSNPVKSNRKAASSKPSNFIATTKAQGEDCDWENWDD